MGNCVTWTAGASLGGSLFGSAVVEDERNRNKAAMSAAAAVTLPIKVRRIGGSSVRGGRAIAPLEIETDSLLFIPKSMRMLKCFLKRCLCQPAAPARECP